MIIPVFGIGNGNNPGLTEIYAVAEKIGLSKERYKQIAAHVRDVVEDVRFPEQGFTLLGEQI